MSVKIVPMLNPDPLELDLRKKKGIGRIRGSHLQTALQKPLTSEMADANLWWSVDAVSYSGPNWLL